MDNIISNEHRIILDQQLINIEKLGCHDRVNELSELGVDVAFQLGPFYVLCIKF